MTENVLITGGTRGIGKAMVFAFAKAGYRVFFTYQSSKDLADEIEKETGALGFAVDFENVQNVTDFCGRFSLEFGGADVLINNAGISQYGLIQDVSELDFDRLFNVNFKSPFFLTQKMIPSMIAKHRGTVINVASIWGETGASCEVLYSSAKGALIAFTKALAKELAPSGIAVNCISPGVVDTDMMARFSHEEKLAITEEIPAGKFVDADEIASLALYLANNSTPSFTGQVLGLNGGMYC